MNILFLGGDKRYEYIMQNLAKKHTIHQIGFDNIIDIFSEDLDSIDISSFDIVLFPISGLSDNLEIKSPKGLIKVPDIFFRNINENTIFITGVKTKKLLELIPLTQIISFFDFEEVEIVNNSLTVEGVIEDIKDKNTDKVCILGYRKAWKRYILKVTK